MTFNGNHFRSLRYRPLGLMAIAAAALGGCLNRPVAKTHPETNNVFVKQNPSGGIDKIDVLFLIDNSLSMGDKQEVLKAAVPQLLRRLTNPDCVDPNGASATKTMDDPAQSCGGNLQREFAPVKDIHIGIVTSSLGDFGGDTCPLPEDDPKGPENSPQNLAQNDHAWLLGALPRNAGAGLQEFLAWGPADAQTYSSSIDARIKEFGSFVSAATELGCGNEMILEAWYRFLIDPKPPVDVAPPKGDDGKQTSGASVREGVDQNILDQRARFLRPDSLLAVFMVADENDCSMRDNTYSWVTMTFGQGFRMWRGSSVCKDNPNDECCYSCMLDKDAPQKCKDMDTACRMGDASAKLPASEDDLNIRCRSMKKRFGYDFLFPASRYVNALTKLKICPDQTYGDLDCECAEAKRKNLPCEPGTAVDNPLYVNLNPKIIPTGPARTGPDAVFLAGVVGVPWQDLAVDANANTLEYMKATDLGKVDDATKKSRWDLFAPKVDEDYSSAQLGDPVMIESFDPRPGLPGPESGRWANPKNGHEWNTSKKDVQFACIFSLEVQLQAGKQATRLCDQEKECGKDDGSAEYKKCIRRFDGCSCVPTQPNATTPSALDPTVTKSPLCQDSQGNFGPTQYFAKAYPGLRELQVLRGFYEATLSDNAIVGSICPKDLDVNNQKGPGYGYNPAVKALVDRLKEKLGGTCLPRTLAIQADGTVPCAIVEAIPNSADPKWRECDANGRDVVNPQLEAAIRSALQRDNICGSAPLPGCDTFGLCKLRELTADTADGSKCLNELNVEKTTATPGFCYVDPSQDHGSAQVVSGCPGSDKRIIRIVGNANSTNAQLAAPAPGKVFIACSGAAYQAPAPEEAATP